MTVRPIDQAAADALVDQMRAAWTMLSPYIALVRHDVFALAADMGLACRMSKAGVCPIYHHADDCDCDGSGGDR